jgi:hypothetical protein
MQCIQCCGPLRDNHWTKGVQSLPQSKAIAIVLATSQPPLGQHAGTF